MFDVLDLEGLQGQYDLNKITEFNPALIYEFDPESLPGTDEAPDQFSARLIPEANQRLDLYNAYLFAQNDILPVLKQEGFDKNTLLDWIKKIHAFMGKTLFLEMYSTIKPGEYTPQPVFRWHHGSELNFEFLAYFSQKHVAKTPKKLAVILEKKYGLPEVDSIAFVDLLNKIKHMQFVHRPSLIEARRLLGSEYAQGAHVFMNLCSAYNLKQLTEEDVRTVNQVLEVCIFPEDIPQAMMQFAEEAVLGYQQCDWKNSHDVARFLAKTFYEFTRIHPFSNGNGRTATCLMNCFVRSKGYSSFLLRHYNDKQDTSSEYSFAIKMINQSREPFEALLLKRMKDAKTQVYDNPVQKHLALFRILASEKIKSLKTKDSTLDLTHVAILTVAASLFEGEVGQEVLNALKERGIEANPSNSVDLKRDTDQLVMLCCALVVLNQIEEKLKNRVMASTAPQAFFQNTLVSTYQQGILHFKKQEYASCRDLMLSCLSLSTIDRLSQARCYSTLASCFRELGELDKALDHIQHALTLLNQDPVKYKEDLSKVTIKMQTICDALQLKGNHPKFGS